MRRFEYRDDRSSKFWEIERQGTQIVTCWGRIGTDGQRKVKDFGTEAKAESGVAKQIQAKTGKGYAEAGVEGAPLSKQAPSTSGPTSGDLSDGQEAQVPGSGGRSYTLKHIGGVYSCSCPAWRNQSVSIERRTCKHLRRFRGDGAEEARLGSLPERARASGAGEGAPGVLLAERWEPDVHDPAGWWMSEKLDGVRAWWDGRRFLSRRGNEFFAPDWFTEALPDHPLDGELFVGRGAFQRTVSIVRRADRSRHWEELSYVVFDGPELAGPFEDRLARLRDRLGTLEGFVRVLPHEVCGGREALVAELARIEGLGGEGLMLRKPGSAYVSGRSDTLLKVKSFQDAEAKVVGHQPGTGRHKGRLGALRVVLPDGTEFKVGTGLSDAEREAPPPVGAVITFRYQELTDGGVPRFPSYVGVREDVEWPADG